MHQEFLPTPVSRYQPRPKFKPRWFGPFEIRRDLGSTVLLKLLATCRANPAFNAAACKRYIEDTINSAPPPPLPIINRDGDEPFIVEPILSQRLFRRQKEFLVEWQGYKKPSWEPAGYLLDESRTPIVPRQKFLHAWFWKVGCVTVLTDCAVLHFLVFSPSDVLCYLSRVGTFPCTCIVCDKFTLALKVSNCS